MGMSYIMKNTTLFKKAFMLGLFSNYFLKATKNLGKTELEWDTIVSLKLRKRRIRANLEIHTVHFYIYNKVTAILLWISPLKSKF